MLLLVLLAGLTATSSGDLQFSHFPLVSRRSDHLEVPLPGEVQSPTGRPGLLAQQDQRDHLLALLVAPSSGQTKPGPGESRPRQKLTSRLLEQSQAVGRLIRSRTRDKHRGRKEEVGAGDKTQLPERKLSSERRLRGGVGRHVNSVNVEQKIEKSLVLRARPRPRPRTEDKEGRTGVAGKKIGNRKKIIKKLKVQEGKKEENEVEPSKGLIQRRVRVKPQRKTLNANVEADAKVDADKVAGRQFQRRLRPRRLQENKEESRGEVISSRLNSVAVRSRTSNKDSDDISGAKYEIEPQVSTLRPGNSSSRPTIESLNIDPRRTQQRKWPTSSDFSDPIRTTKTPLTTPQPAERETKSSVTEKGFSLLDESFLPTIRNLISKKSRKRFRKIKTNTKSGRRRLKGENDLIIDSAKFREKENLNLETTTSRTLVNLITTTTTLINLITSTHPVSPALRKNSRARGGGGRTKHISGELKETTTTTEPTTTTTTTTTTITTTTSESGRDGSRISTEPNYQVEESTVYNPHKSRVSSRRNEITGTRTEARTQLPPLTYDLEKALKHAEITWAQDPFRKTTGLPGKPSFDIDFSKNPAAPAFGPPLRSNPGPNFSPVSRRKISSNLRVGAPAGPQISSPSPSSDPSRKPLETILWTPEQLRGLIQ